jgi:hypothetical protein
MQNRAYYMLPPAKINVSYRVNPLIISALCECPLPAAAKKIYGASKSQKSLCDF